MPRKLGVGMPKRNKSKVQTPFLPLQPRQPLRLRSPWPRSHHPRRQNGALSHLPGVRSSAFAWRSEAKAAKGGGQKGPGGRAVVV